MTWWATDMAAAIVVLLVLDTAATAYMLARFREVKRVCQQLAEVQQVDSHDLDTVKAEIERYMRVDRG